MGTYFSSLYPRSFPVRKGKNILIQLIASKSYKPFTHENVQMGADWPFLRDAIGGAYAGWEGGQGGALGSFPLIYCGCLLLPSNHCFSLLLLESETRDV